MFFEFEEKHLWSMKTFDDKYLWSLKAFEDKCLRNMRTNIYGVRGQLRTII